MAWITVALCMFPLIGHTQAFSLGFTTTAPSHFLSEEDLGLKLLDEISCVSWTLKFVFFLFDNNNM